MPACLKRGIPPLALADITQGLWEGQSQDNFEQIASAAEVPFSFGDFFGLGLEAFYACQAAGNTSVYASEFFAPLKGKFGKPELPPPSPCSEPAAFVPNVFSDGSVKQPEHPHFSLGGLGVLHTDRLVACALHPSEEHCLFSQFGADGLSVWTNVPGPLTTSTRTELAGGLMALFHPGPVRIVSDNAAFVHGAQAILSGRSPSRSKPWALQTDGDLWLLFYTHAHAKGLDSIAVDWAKGHTTLDDVSTGITTLWNHLGNGKADILATHGVETHGEGILQLGHIFDSRQSILVKIVIAIFTHFEAVFDAEAKRKLLMRTLLSNGEVMPIRISPMLPSIPVGSGRPLNLWWPAQNVIYIPSGCAITDMSSINQFRLQKFGIS